MPTVRETTKLEVDNGGIVLGQMHRDVVNRGSVGGLSKGGAVVETVAKDGKVTNVAGKLHPDFEATIADMDQAIQ